MKDDLPQKLDEKEVVKRYIKSIDKGLLKVMSKMGISTYQSYCGAQIFDAVGLRQDFVDKYFTGTHTRIEGVGLAEIAEETVRRHRDAFGDSPIYESMLDVGGDYAVRVRGEDHVWTAETVARLQHAVRGNSQDHYRAFAKIVNEQNERLLDHPRPVPHRDGGGRRPQAGAARGSRAGQEHRAALLHRRHVVRLDLARSAHHARHRHEPHRRQVEHRRRRRGSRPLQAAAERRFDALGDQAGGLGPLRRHRRVSRQLGHDADQDGAGRQARRRRPIARPQGRQDHRQGAPFDARRRPDLAAAASRHLFDRGSGAAHLRSEERQPDRRRVGEARLRSRRRHGRRRRLQGARRPRHHRRLRGRHRRFPAHLDQARRQPMGNRPRRNPPDAGDQPAARAHLGAGRRRHPHRPRRGGRRAARRRRIRLRHRAA